MFVDEKASLLPLNSLHVHFMSAVCCRFNHIWKFAAAAVDFGGSGATHGFSRSAVR